MEKIMNDERALADANGYEITDEPSLVPNDIEAQAAELTIEDWIAGVRPTRRSVKLYPHAHLIARLEEIADQIQSAPAGADVDALVDEFEATKAQFEDGVWFTLEGRGSEWVEKFRDETAKRLGIDKEKPGPGAVKIILHQVAAQIVAPGGVTGEVLERLVEANEAEANKLIDCLQKVNGQAANKAGVLTLDFSSRRSGRRRSS